MIIPVYGRSAIHSQSCVAKYTLLSNKVTRVDASKFSVAVALENGVELFGRERRVYIGNHLGHVAGQVEENGLGHILGEALNAFRALIGVLSQ
jgi:hypothetical protein